MMQYITLGPTPYDEECAQVGTTNYQERALLECNAYRKQLYRILEAHGYKRENLPEGFSLVIKSQAHDFGTYHEVNAKFDDENAASRDLALFLDRNCPDQWDDEARAELTRR